MTLQDSVPVVHEEEHCPYTGSRGHESRSGDRCTRCGGPDLYVDDLGSVWWREKGAGIPREEMR